MERPRIKNPFAIMNPADQRANEAAKKEGLPFLAFRGADGRLQTHELSLREVTLGRSAECDICLSWDDAVSATNLVLTRLGNQWRIQVVAATNLVSLYRPADPINGRSEEFFFLDAAHPKLLKSGDLVLVGDTSLGLWIPPSELAVTRLTKLSAPPVRTTRAERRVLAVLCRPIIEAPGDPEATPASDREIAAELGNSVGTIEKHVSNLAKRFGLGDLPAGRKRLALARHAMRQGIVGTASD